MSTFRTLKDKRDTELISTDIHSQQSYDDVRNKYRQNALLASFGSVLKSQVREKTVQSYIKPSREGYKDWKANWEKELQR